MMNSTMVAQFDATLEIARNAGYEVRFEYFGGTGGGICEFAGRKVLFIDLALPKVEQLERITHELKQTGLINPAGRSAA